MRINNNSLFLTPREIYDDAIIDSDNGVIIYSWEKVIECGIKEHGSWEDSLDWHDHNTFCAYMGEGTPIFKEEDYE